MKKFYLFMLMAVGLLVSGSMWGQYVNNVIDIYPSEADADAGANSLSHIELDSHNYWHGEVWEQAMNFVNNYQGAASPLVIKATKFASSISYTTNITSFNKDVIIDLNNNQLTIKAGSEISTNVTFKNGTLYGYSISSTLPMFYVKGVDKAIALTLKNIKNFGNSSVSSTYDGYELINFSNANAESKVVIDGNVNVKSGKFYTLGDRIQRNPGSKLTLNMCALKLTADGLENNDNIVFASSTSSSTNNSYVFDLNGHTFTNNGSMTITILKSQNANNKLINNGEMLITSTFTTSGSSHSSLISNGSIENNNKLTITTAKGSNANFKLINNGWALINTWEAGLCSIVNSKDKTMTIEDCLLTTKSIENSGLLNLCSTANAAKFVNNEGGTCNFTYNYQSGKSTIDITNDGIINISSGLYAVNSSGCSYSGEGTISVSGGTFNDDAVNLLTKNAGTLPVATGYIALPTLVVVSNRSQGGVFVVSNDTPGQYPCDATISDGDKIYYYSVFKDAVAAMSQNVTFNKLTLVRDVENAASLSELPANTTIDLNQKKLFLRPTSSSSQNPLKYQAAGTLIVKNGTIQYDGRQAEGAIFLTGSNAPTLELEDVIFEFVYDAGASANRAVAIASDGSVIYCKGNTVLPDLKLANNVTVNIASTASVSGAVESSNKTIEVNNKGSFTLNKHGYTGNAPTIGALTINNEGTTEINNTIINGNGSTSAININNISGTTTLINPTCTSATINLSKTAGTIQIQGGKYYSDVTFTGDATISGGMYKYDEEVLAWLEQNVDKTKYQIETSKDGTTDVYTVGPAELFVVNVNGINYSSLASALQNVPTDGSETEVILLQDCSDQITIGANQNVKLNLGSYTLTNKNNSAPCISVNGTLTIVADSLPDGTQLGTIDGGGNSAIKYTNKAAIVTINAGKFMASGSKSVILMGYISEGTGGTLTINAGEFHGTPRYGAGSIVSANQTDNESVIVINGGRFDAQMSGTYKSGFDLIHLENRYKSSSLTIHGGLFTLNHIGEGKVTTGHQISCISAMGASCSLEITGGQFFNQVPADHFENTDNGLQLSSALIVYQNLNNVSISGGEFRSNGTGAQIYAQNANISLENAIFEGKNYAGLWITGFSGAAPMNINGGHFMGKYGIAVWNDANVTIDWCQCEGTSYGLYSYGNSNITLNGGSFTGENNGVYMKENGTMDVKSVTITSNTASALRVGGTAMVHVVETPIITSNGTYSFYNDGGNVTIDGGRFLGPNGTKNESGTTIISAGIYNLDPIVGTGCSLKDYEVIDNLDPSTKDVYPYTIGPKTYTSQTVDDQNDSRTIDWQTVTTWKGDQIIPDEGDDVTIADGKDVEVGQSKKTEAYAHQITVDNGSNLIVDGGSKLTIGNGGLTIGTQGDGGEIILKSTADEGTGVLLFSPVANEEVTAVEATIELHTTAHKNSDDTYFWNYIGIPLKLNAGEFKAENWEKLLPDRTPYTGYSYLQTWNFTEGWVNKTLEAFAAFRGVAITNDSEEGVIYRFKGKMVGNADKKMDFAPRGYNFFANSYTAPIDVQTLLTELEANGVVDAVIYMFDTENGRFADVSLGAFSGFHAPYFRVIPSMNGFFILNQKYQASERTLNYGAAVYNCALGNRPIFAPKHDAMSFSRVHINVEADGSKDGVYLIENDEFTSEFENGYDVIKYMTSGQSNIYAQTTDGRQSELFNSDIEGTMIGFQAAANQTMYTMSFDEVQGDAFVLVDMMTGETVAMNEGNTYTFFAEAGQTNDNRFLVTRANKVPTTIGGLKNNAKVQGIYSVTGHYFGNVTEWNRLPQGVYMVNGVKVVK